MFEGTYELAASQETIWKFITDPAKVGECLPDVKSLEVKSETESEAIIRVGVGPIRSDFKFRIEIVERQPPNHVRLKASGTGSGSNIILDCVIDLSNSTKGCVLSYRSDVKVGGIMTGLGQRVMQDAAQRTIGSIFDCIGHHVT